MLVALFKENGPLTLEQRKLAAIMFTDVVGFTSLSQRNEALSLRMLDEQRGIIRPIISRHSGTEIKTMGDGFLVEFPSALEAVRCAYDIQRATREFNITLPEDQRLHLRIGIHLGDVIKSGEDISGDAVNIASRIEPLADVGGICLTRQVYDQVENKFELPLTINGIKTLKNVRMPVEVYRIEMPWTSEEERKAPSQQQFDTKRIAVLPFTNMSPDPNDSFFADGITEEIISTVSSVGDISVISRTSVMGYKGTTKKLKEIGTELEVGSVLEGSIRKYGNKIRITTQLVDVNKDAHIWAKSYDRELDDVFAVQSDIAKEVAEALRVKIFSNELKLIKKKPTEDTAAYTLYLKGRQSLWKRGIEDIRAAAELFTLAINEDPEFALGYVGLADACELLSSNWSIDSASNHGRAKGMIRKALELEPDLAEARASLALTLVHDLRLEDAEREFRHAIELKPSYATAHQWFSGVLLAKEKWNEAHEEIDKALELDPLSPIININYAGYYNARRDYESALKMAQKAVELDDTLPSTLFALAETYAKLKMFPEAKQAMAQGLRLVESAYPHAKELAEAVMAYYENDKATVARLLPELERHWGETFGPNSGTIAGLHLMLGERDLAFEWLEKGYSSREAGIIYLKQDEFFDRVRDDPRYLDLVERLGLNTAA